MIEYPYCIFLCLGLLNQEVYQKQTKAVKTPASTSLKDYLRSYETNSKQCKKKNKKTQPYALGFLVLDDDPVQQKPINLREEYDDDLADEEKPQIDEDIKVKRMKRLEQLISRHPYHDIQRMEVGSV
ncbi:hypothetical protein L1049_027150 [Liquidambar formosana]|uniref:Uncharacterized protein n=1 Tax=Liquidambar formosana TaxID=63359 RepID=A0AAP0N701_LIQFO